MRPLFRMGTTKKPTVRQPGQPDLKMQICGELYIAIERLGAGPELLSVVGGWRDNLDDKDVLRMLTEYNAGRRTVQRQW